MTKFALAYFPDEPRCLVSISFNTIYFNLSGYKTFETAQAAEDFKSQWKHHFFGLEKLTVIEVKEK